jgi:hypothetical protein
VPTEKSTSPEVPATAPFSDSIELRKSTRKSKGQGFVAASSSWSDPPVKATL